MTVIFSDFLGFCLLGDPRARCAAEIQKRQVANVNAMLNASSSIYGDTLAAANWRPFEKPLDERFADFKIRLAAAIERRRKA